MSTPVLDTKLYPPSTRRGLVARPRLDQRLEPSDGARLRLISAPAGFGKTTLLATWLEGLDDGSAVAWVSLDERDGQATAFWTYVLTALERAAPGTAAGALTLLQAGQVPVETVLAAMLNELTVLPDDLHLVLDDYHLADTPDVAPGLTYFLDHLPPHVHLTISTRADPALPLARLRARGELVEVRAADLRMNAAEVAAYLGDATGLDLAEPDVAALETRTEGWVAALQLAALSLRDRDDASAFVAEFAGDDRYVVDYLVEEVLDRLPEETRDFLLQTSVLERMTGPLCDAVTDAPGGQRVLERLERQNMFVVPLDGSRRAYRYHHLFADVLRTRLAEERPDEVAELHARASRWYDAAGEPVLAVGHALAAGDVVRAAELMELSVTELQRHRQERVIADWADLLPDEVVQVRPLLAIGLVGGLMTRNRLAGVSERLDATERALAGPPEDLVVVDPAGLGFVPPRIEMYRAALALAAGDPALTIRHAQRAIERAEPDDHQAHAAASALSGLASWAGGDLEAAHRHYAAAAAGLERAGHLADVLACSITLGDLELTLGRRDEARRTFERALGLVEGDPDLRGSADMHVGLSRVAREEGDLDAAREHLRIADSLGEGLPQNPYRWRVAMAAVRELEGDLDAALALLDEAQRVYVGDYSPDVRPVAAHRARVLVTRGDLAEARRWASERGLSAADEPSYLREFEHLTLARILVAEGSPDAVPLLDRLLAAAEAGGRAGSAEEIRALRAVATGEVPLLDARQTAPAPRPDPADLALVDPLSERELDVLRLLASDLSGPEIARHLVVELSTVRTHTKRIYTKLGVNSRRAAVTRAHQLALV